MDPLSVTTGAIAVVGAIHQATKCINRLRAIRQAPIEIQLLLEEVADLDDLLKQIRNGQRPPEYGDGRPPPKEQPRGLDLHISRTATKLSDLDQLLQHHSSRTHRRAPDFSWARGQSKANALREELRILRLNLAASLAAATSDTVNRVESAVERVHAEQKRAGQLLVSLVGGLTLAHPASPSRSPLLEVNCEDGSLNCTFQYPDQISKRQRLAAKSRHEHSKMTRHPLTVQNSARSQAVQQPVQVYAKKSTAACESWCSCACHAKGILRARQTKLVGSISISYSGIPWATASCDQKSCRSRSLPAISMTVQFPAWFWKRYLSSSFAYTPIRGPEINVKLPRTVSWASSLWGHALEGNLRALQDLFSQGLASPWDVQSLGGSLLHYATDHGHWDLCKFLVHEGASLDREDDFHNTPASLAWEKVLSGTLTQDQESMVTNMFTNTDYLQTRQFTILHKIVLCLIPRTLQSELDYSTRDLDAVDSSGRSCLCWAAARGDRDSLTTLISYGANVNLSDGQGNTPLHHARNVTCIDILLNAGANIQARNEFGHTPLHTVCRGTGNLALLKRLLDAGIAIDATDHGGETALSNATYNRHIACALLLIRRNANLDFANGGGDATIQMSLYSKVPAVLRELLRCGAVYTKANALGRTILHIAAEMADRNALEVLQAHGLKGCDIEARDIDGKTARDILHARCDDDVNPEFKLQFSGLLNCIAAGVDGGMLVCSKTETETKISKAVLVDEWASVTSMVGALDILKDGTVTCLTPVGSDDGCVDDDDFEDSWDTHGAPVFYDALEEVHNVPRVVEIEV